MVLSRIESVSRVKVDKIYQVQSTSRNYVTLGPESMLCVDDISGLKNERIDNWNGQSVLTAGSLEALPKYLPTFFDLLAGDKEPLRLVMIEDTVKKIKTRLEDKYAYALGIITVIVIRLLAVRFHIALPDIYRNRTKE